MTGAATTDSPPNLRISTKVFYWWADSTWAQSALLFVMTTIAGIGYYDPELITDNWFPEPKATVVDASVRAVALQQSVQTQADAESDQINPPRIETFQVAGGDCILVATVENPTAAGFFTPENLRALYRVAEGVEKLPQVESVLWLDNVPGFNLFGLTGTLVPSPNASPRQMETARKRVLDNPLAVGQLISPDGNTLLMHVSLDWFYVDTDASASTAIRSVAEQLAGEVDGKVDGKVDGATIKFQITGSVPLDLMMAGNHMADAAKYQLIGYSIMLISALVLFRGLSAVIIVAIAPAMGVFWTMGMVHFFDLQDNPFNDIIVPVLISLVGLTDSVHLMTEIRQQRASGRETSDAARTGVARVGMACFLTSFTTAIGFVSLTWAHHEIVKDFGWSCVVGVVMTFISVLTVIPLGCRSPLGRRLHVGIGKSLVDGQLKRIGPVVDWVLKKHRTVSRVAIVSTLALVALSLQLTPDEKRYSGLSDSGEAAQALRHLDKSLGGLEFGFVDVNWSDQNSDEELLDTLHRIDEILRDEPLIGHPLGLHQLLRALPGEGDSRDRMSLLDLLPASLKRSFYSPEYKHAKIQFRIQDRGIAAYSETFTRIERALEQETQTHPGFVIRLSGDAIWRWKNVFQIVSDLATSLGTASIVIWLVLTVVYRSIRIGLISIVPNLFPLAATGALLVICGQHLEMVTVCVFTICIGIAVDDSIHFLTRYTEELREGGGHETIIRRAFTGVGSALLMTTLVLVTGLGSAILGDARDARLFGIMGCLTLTTALFADIVFLPALLKRFAKPLESQSNL